ncbi:MAG: alpha/beta hydrolase, partial [Bryobacteraceae bacterium]
RPVLAGHSIAGEELSSIGSRFPAKVAGLIYLDAAFPYAFYDQERGNLAIDAPTVQKQLDQLRPGAVNGGVQSKLIKELLETTLPQLQKALKEQQKDLDSRPAALGPALPPGPSRSILEGQQKYTEIRVPILAIFALPHAPLDSLKGFSQVVAKMEARDIESTGAQAKAFEAAMPSAKVVRLPHADHYVFRSNTDEVLREMNAFLSGLH